MLRSFLILTLVAGFAHAAPPGKKPASAAAFAVMQAATGTLTPGGTVLPWDRYAVAWVHPSIAAPRDLDAARQAAAKQLGVADPGRLVTLSLARLSVSMGEGAAKPFFADSDLSRALSAGALDFELFIDLSAIASAVSTLATRDGLNFDLRADVGLIRLSDKTFEHRIWLTDVPIRMMWSGQPFLPTCLAMIAEAHRAIGDYARLRKQLERWTGAPVQVIGPRFVNPKLPPAGSWRYQEMLAEDFVQEAPIRTAIALKKPLGGTLIQVPLPVGTDPLEKGPHAAPLLTRAGNGYQAGYLVEKPEGSHWLTPRLAQDRGWEPEALDERVTRDAPALPLRGWIIAVPGLEGKALLAIGRYASALALYPGALKAVAFDALKKPSRLRAVTATTHALVVTVPEVPREELARLRDMAAAAQATLLGAPTARVELDSWVDLPLEATGACAFSPIALPTSAEK